MGNTVSIIIPFYDGNKFLSRVLSSIEKVEKSILKELNIKFEILIMNDSPQIDVVIPKRFINKKNIVIINNKKNQGIHQTKVNGFFQSKGANIIFLDQDDELLVDGFKKQLELIKDNDIVIGNSLLEYGEEYILSFKNACIMKLLVNKNAMLNIRNFVPSLGTCLIKRSAIPQYWLENVMHNNGSDDYYLLILLLCNNAKIAFNQGLFFIHHDTGNGNLSKNLLQMYKSNQEVLMYLINYGNISNKECMNFERAIGFKYYQDSKQLNLNKIFKYRLPIIKNIFYKLKLFLLYIFTFNQNVRIATIDRGER